MATQAQIQLTKATKFINDCAYNGRTIDNLSWSNTYDAPVLAKLERAWAIVKKYSK